MRRERCLRPILGATVLVLSVLPSPAASQAASGDPLATDLLGSWVGEGFYEGNRLELTREWSLALGGQFLTVDMGVLMSNGASFSSRSYWRPEGEGLYEVVILDELGRIQTVRGVRDADSGDVSMHVLDELADSGPGWRRWVYRSTGEDSYVELLFGETSEGWVQLAMFSFRRPPDR